MRKIMTKLLLVMTLAFPVFVQAQDTATPDFPTQEVATLEPTLFVTETPTEVPTETATPAPTETPIPVPPPIDQTKVFESFFSVAMVLIVGVVAIGLAVIVGLFRLLSAPVRAILLSGIKTGVDEAGKIAEKTETPIDDLAITELRKLVERLEAELRATQDQVSVNSQSIADTNRAVSQAISNR